MAGSSESASLDESSDEGVYNSCVEDVEQMSLLADDESKSKRACSEAKQNIPTRTDGKFFTSVSNLKILHMVFKNPISIRGHLS